MPNLMKQNGPPQHGTFAPQTVFFAMMPMAITGMRLSSAPKALTVGSHAGTGAPGGMPAHAPKNTSVKKANSA